MKYFRVKFAFSCTCVNYVQILHIISCKIILGIYLPQAPLPEFLHFLKRESLFSAENIDVILATRGIGEHNSGILFGYQEFTRTYHLSVSTSNQTWELQLPEYPLGWVHVGIAWSKQWGLRFYRNGVLAAELTSPRSLPYHYGDIFTTFTIGRDRSLSAVKREKHLQIADLRIWESVIPQQKMQELYGNTSK